MFWYKRLIVLIIGLIGFSVSAQVYCYCNVIEKNNKVDVVFANNPPYISLDFQERMLRDIETNQPIKFNNAMECINQLTFYGWEVVSTSQNSNTINYTLRNKLNNPYHSSGRLQRDMRIIEEYEKKYIK